MAKTPVTKKNIVTLTHDEASRKNIPTAEYQSVMRTDEQSPIRVAYERRNRDLDPQLVWRGKDEQDRSDLVVPAPPLYIQEKIHPKVLIDDLRRRSDQNKEKSLPQFDLFADFNGLPNDDAKTEFYQHDAHWSNRMILGDSVQVMASLAEREGLRGKVQCIYLDPPYGIKFNSNFQWSTTSRDVKDGNIDHITREPEQVKAFRDTWRDGIHSYLAYLRDRMTAARDLLSESGSVFVQIGDENIHSVRALMDEVFGQANSVSLITVQKAGSTFSRYLGGISDFVLWYAKDIEKLKYRALFANRPMTSEDSGRFTLAQIAVGQRKAVSELAQQPPLTQLVAPDPLQSASAGRDKGEGAASWFPVSIAGREFRPTMQSRWKTNEQGMERLLRADRIIVQDKTIRYARRFSDFSVQVLSNIWTDLAGATDKVYVVQTATKIVERCLLMTTDPGDLVLDPTCGSGTTASVAEQWGRRWITIDTSRVALALARARIMGARYPFYLLADSRDGQLKEAEVTRTTPSSKAVLGNIRHGFVYQRVPHIMLSSIVKNSEIDVIWETRRSKLEEIMETLRLALKSDIREWDIPLEAESNWSEDAKDALREWWSARNEQQVEIDESISTRAEMELLYDRPYEDNKKVRVAGPFTVESLSPHRVLAVDENDEFIEETSDPDGDARDAANFVQVILDNLQTTGVQQADKSDKVTFSSLAVWPGERVCAEGRFLDDEGTEKRAAIFVGPEFGTVSRPDLVSAAREAGDAAFDVLIACAFNYDAHSSEFNRLGRIPVLKARMNADLHMAADLKNTGKGNLFVIFGEPDIRILDEKSGEICVKVNGVDVFHPSTGEVRSDGPDGIACWFVDTDYNEESFFVRQAYFLGANDPYKALKTTLKAEINEDAWATLHSDTSRPFPKPESGRIAVKVINHLGDEVMKVFKVN